MGLVVRWREMLEAASQRSADEAAVAINGFFRKAWRFRLITATALTDAISVLGHVLTKAHKGEALRGARNEYRNVLDSVSVRFEACLFLHFCVDALIVWAF